MFLLTQEVDNRHRILPGNTDTLHHMILQIESKNQQVIAEKKLLQQKFWRQTTLL